MRHRRHPVLTEQVGEQAHHHLAVFQHIGNAAGHAQIVFQHKVLTRARRAGCAHDVDAGNMGINLIGNVHPHHDLAKLGVVLNLFSRHDAGFQNVLVVVDIVHKPVQGRDPLHQTGFHAAPFLGGDDARNQIERDQALGARTVFVFRTIYGEGDAHAPENHLGLGPTGLHGGIGLLCQPLGIAAVMLTQRHVKRQVGGRLKQRRLTLQSLKHLIE